MAAYVSSLLYLILSFLHTVHVLVRGTLAETTPLSLFLLASSFKQRISHSCCLFFLLSLLLSERMASSVPSNTVKHLIPLWNMDGKIVNSNDYTKSLQSTSRNLKLYFALLAVVMAVSAQITSSVIILWAALSGDVDSVHKLINHGFPSPAKCPLRILSLSFTQLVGWIRLLNWFNPTAKSVACIHFFSVLSKCLTE